MYSSLQELCFYEYEEPLMGPRFYPTYKKIPNRGKVRALFFELNVDTLSCTALLLRYS